MTPTTTPILGRRTLLLLTATFGGLSSFYLLLSVVPLYLADAGSGTAGVGLATGVMMLATVLLELVVTRLLDRIGYRAALGLGLLLFGAPVLALLASSATWLVLVVSAVRGVGLGLVVVVGSALVAGLAPPGRRSEALALYGVVAGIPAVIGVPAGIWLSERIGFAPVFVLAAVVALLPLPAAMALPPVVPASDAAAPGSLLGAMRDGGFARPALIFAAVTLGAGVYATFLPLAVPADAREVAAVALLAQAVAMSVARLAAGRFGDRHGSGRLLVPAVLAAVTGGALVTWTASPTATVAGMILFGAGFGATQNVTLALMMDRSHPGEYGRTSALWNLAYDGGFGVGAVGIGLLIGPVGYVTGFAITAAVLVAALVPAWVDRRWGR
ncbi:MFS transporter [Virgisporangium ochraceum]|uniref:MFS transporter n=1 Tax=Virgisporangium ochraceum TaxID=65505 RepID=A0A8J4EES1_9ACTN|nr:MFS transporter [Virgisporangium ochraceum]GIJ71923.1 MFS transporter [Virgisporangium ochraceum]